MHVGLDTYNLLSRSWSPYFLDNGCAIIIYIFFIIILQYIQFLYTYKLNIFIDFIDHSEIENHAI